MGPYRGVHSFIGLKVSLVVTQRQNYSLVRSGLEFEPRKLEIFIFSLVLVFGEMVE